MTDTTVRSPAAEGTVFAVILAVSFCHFINDVVQSLLSALYPMLKDDFQLEFWQIGLLTMAFMVTASLLAIAVAFFIGWEERITGWFVDESADGETVSGDLILAQSFSKFTVLMSVVLVYIISISWLFAAMGVGA